MSFTTFQWALRNFVWSNLGPAFAHFAWTYLPIPSMRDALLNGFFRLVDLALLYVIRGHSTYPTDQQIRYPEVGFGHDSRYTFSIWAFPEEEYIDSLRDYFRFCNDYYRATGIPLQHHQCRLPHRARHELAVFVFLPRHGDHVRPGLHR